MREPSNSNRTSPSTSSVPSVLPQRIELVRLTLPPSPTPILPPYVDECPDYWEVGGEQTCNNINDLGKCGGGLKNFTNFKYGGKTGVDAKRQWANECGITWSGITTN